jgi:hypothetical protein
MRAGLRAARAAISVVALPHHCAKPATRARLLPDAGSRETKTPEIADKNSNEPAGARDPREVRTDGLCARPFVSCKQHKFGN